VPSVWITTRKTTNGGERYRVEYQLDWRKNARYGGSFKTKREAQIRKSWIVAELAALRVPDLSILREPNRAPTLAETIERWKSSRVDVSDGTRVFHRVALDRLLPYLGDRRVDEIGVEDLNETVVTLSEKGRKPATIRKSIQTLAIVLDDAGSTRIPPAGRSATRTRRRSNRSLRRRRTSKPSSDSSRPLIVSRSSGSTGPAHASRPSSISASGTTTSLPVASASAPRRRRRGKRYGSNSRDALAEAIEATLPPREDRDPEARLFPGTGADRLRTAIARACKAAGIPPFSPHDLRHRRISLLHDQGRTWAQIGQFVGQRKLSVTSDTYTHVLSDGREVDLVALLTDV
jgi:hypothetical protein